MKIAMAPSKHARGVQPPGYDGKTYDWREKGEANTAGIEARYEVLDVGDALERVWFTDSHFVGYVVHGPDGAALGRQPRVCKGAVPWLKDQGYAVRVWTLAADVDNPGHLVWTGPMVARAMETLASANVASTAGVYFTVHGLRLVQPLASPFAVDEAETALNVWLDELVAAGFAVDRACRDWTRHFRAPLARRPGHRGERPRVPMLESMVAVERPRVTVVSGARSRTVGPRAVPSIAFRSEVPEGWAGWRIGLIAGAVRDIATEWHTLSLALAGALVRRGIAHADVPAVVGAVFAETGADSKVANRVAAARTTVTRHAAGLSTTGLRELRVTWPSVADAVMSATARGTGRDQVRPGDHPPANEASAGLLEVMRAVGDGVHAVGAECGLGKTRAAQEVALERAAKTHKSPDAKGTRAPAQSKTGLSVPTHTLAAQVAGDLRARGANVLRVFGPLSVVDEHGKPVCKFHDAAAALQAGGQSVPWEVCAGRGKQPCEHRETCPAADGQDGPEDARIVVGPHAMVDAISGAVGSTGLVVIDEPPSMLESETFREADFDTALAIVDAFEGYYGVRLEPCVRAVRAWFERGLIDQRSTLAEIAAEHAGDSANALVNARAARKPNARGGPPLRLAESARARRYVSLARQLGTASRVFGAVHAAAVAEAPVVWRIDETPRGRVLVMTAPRADYVAALRRPGSVVVMDAAIEMHVPTIARVVGYDPPMHVFRARDGAPVERVQLFESKANRSGAWAHGRPVWSKIAPMIARAVREAGSGTVGLITWKAVRLVLDTPGDDVDRAWKLLGMPAGLLEEGRAALASVIEGLRGRVLLGHYGAMRGLNSMSDVDTLVTVGDPWVNKGQSDNDAAYLGVDPEAWFEDQARAELEQAHGRLRSLHRTRPARAIHLGAVRPGGAGWSSAKVRVLEQAGGRPQNERAMDVHEARKITEAAGGTRHVAERLGCDMRTVQRYLSGTRKIPAGVAQSWRELSPNPETGDRNPSSDTIDSVEGFRSRPEDAFNANPAEAS